MGWTQKLIEVYDHVIQYPVSEDGNQTELIPVGFTPKKIQYVVTIRKDGSFSSAVELEPDSIFTVPSTPEAESRTGDNGTPFPLADQLKYLCEDGTKNPRLDNYLKQLKDWCDSENAPECLKTLYTYLEKRTLLQDMCGIARLKIKYHKDEKKAGDGADAKAIVCFAVQDRPGTEIRLWMRGDVKASWNHYYTRPSKDGSSFCYITGKPESLLDNHPKVQGNAKLISAKDDGYPFQYKGRFAEDRSAADIGRESSQKVHSALRYLMGRQGFRKYGMNIVAWNVQTGAIPVPIAEDDDAEEEPYPDTFESYAQALKDCAAGYGRTMRNFLKNLKHLSEEETRMTEIVILGMESATDGRMSVNYYQEFPGNTYEERLRSWYEKCCWEYWNKDKTRRIDTPTPLEIARAVMGDDAVMRAVKDYKCEKSDAKLLRDIYKRLLCCITGEMPLPQNMLRSAIHRAESPLSFRNEQGKWMRNAWESCLRTTCALIRCNRADDGREKPTAALNLQSGNRDYLYGRLLAVADALERETQSDKMLPTNAISVMQFFVQRPAEAWLRLHNKLLPYLQSLGADNKAAFYQRRIGEIERLFLPEERMNLQPLGEDFLIGLYAQRRDMGKTADSIPAYSPSCNRSELYGCLLAVADAAEWRAESEKKGEITISDRDGATLALRFLNKLTGNPAETWEQIHKKLLPYLEKLGIKENAFYFEQFRCIETRFSHDERESGMPLDSMVLHGYYAMRQLIRERGSISGIRHQTDAGDGRERAYGTWLALENRIERFVLDRECTEKDNRSSNAIRFLSAYANAPATVQEYLAQRLKPYLLKLRRYEPGLAYAWEQRMAAIESKIRDHGWNTEEPLKAEWLHYYYTRNQ